jgi:hypothetical protein
VNSFVLFHNISGKIKVLEHMENGNDDTGEIMSIQGTSSIYFANELFGSTK